MDCYEKKKTVRDGKRKKALINRLKRIEGQLRGLQTMVENDAYCNDILIQSAAAKAALDSFNKEILFAHIKGCVCDKIKIGDEEIIGELTETFSRLMR